MEIRDWLNIIALIIAPILALQIQKWLEKYREDRKRKLDIFKTLMSTRANRVSIEHVEALNMIDVEFYKKDKYKKVVKAWRTYHDYLSNTNSNDANFGTKSDDLFIILLSEMGESLDYKFDDVMLRRNAYSPVAHGNIEFEQQIIRKGYADLFSGKRAFPVFFTNEFKNPTNENE